MRKDTDNTPQTDSSSAHRKTRVRQLVDRVPFGFTTLATAGVVVAATTTAAFAAPMPESGGAHPEQAPRPAAAASAHPGQAGGQHAQAKQAQQKPHVDPAKAEQKLRGQIVDNARGELGTTETGDNCQPYSDQCVSWCALFAMDMWETAGVDVNPDDYAFTGDVYTTGQEHGTAYDADQLDQAKPGDVLLFGSDPSSASTSKHVGIVESVDGNNVTLIEGNSGDNADSVVRKDHQLSPDTFYGGVSPW